MNHTTNKIYLPFIAREYQSYEIVETEGVKKIKELFDNCDKISL